MQEKKSSISSHDLTFSMEKNDKKQLTYGFHKHIKEGHKFISWKTITYHPS